MDSIRVSEAPDSGSIPDEATKPEFLKMASEIPVFSSTTPQMRTLSVKTEFIFKVRGWSISRNNKFLWEKSKIGAFVCQIIAGSPIKKEFHKIIFGARDVFFKIQG